MIQKLYAIRDIKSDYKTPFVGLSNDEVIRTFHKMVNDPKSGNLYEYPSDYELYFIGEFDTEIAQLLPKKSADFLVGAQSLKALRPEATQ